MPNNNHNPRRSKMNSGMYSSCSDEWATPDDVFQWLDEQFGFDLDVCASRHNHKCSRYFTRETDGLSQEWTGFCWMNPPYGRPMNAWMRKAVTAANAGATVVCLVPARTDTQWWQNNVPAAAEVWFLDGRVKFIKHRPDGTEVPSTSPTFPSAVVVFRPDAPDGGPVLRHVTPPGRRRRARTVKRPAA